MAGEYKSICTVYTHVASTEQSFLASEHVYGAYGSEASICERWHYVLTFVPEMRDLSLSASWSRLNPVLTAIYADAPKQRVLAALELVLLRMQFFVVLDTFKLGLKHVNEFEFEACAAWRDKLFDRYQQAPGDHFKGGVEDVDEDEDAEERDTPRGAFVRAPTRYPTQHRWLQ